MITDIDGGVTATPGIRAAGVTAGLKPSGLPDLALVAADRPVAAAGVQTTNQVQAAPVRLTARHLANGRAQAVLLNSGSANACTGAPGDAVAADSAAAVGAALGCAAEDVLVCSTGLIGVLPPREALLGGISRAATALRPDGGGQAATAIMTTDTVPKEAAVGAGGCVVGGMAKGSGMIDPAMATLLCVLTTDAPVAGPALQATLRRAVDRTFNRITVDGCMSTNDAVLLLATGTAPDADGFEDALTAVCAGLAEALVRDGEGASRVLHVRVTGARREDEALGVARPIAGSALVKTALAGGDPNWGRVLQAMGAGPVRFDPDRVTLTFNDVTVFRGGLPAPFDLAAAEAALKGPDVDLVVDLGLGEAQATVLTCDLTHGYVSINADYTT